MTYTLEIRIHHISEKDLKEIADDLKFITERNLNLRNKRQSVHNDYPVTITAIEEHLPREDY